MGRTTLRIVKKVLIAMGLCSSCCNKRKPLTDHEQEAKDYENRKNTGFKDPGLQKHMKECENQKKKLRHVEDPEIARKKKIQQIKENNKEKETVGPLGITQNELQNK